MKIASGHIACIALGLSLMATTVSAQSIPTIAGNLIVERGQADNDSNFYLLDTNYAFTSTGSVDRWEIYADATNPVQLVIYRQRGDVFLEVGRSNVVTPAFGYNLFSLDQPIKVEAGNFVGAYHPSKGSISFTDYCDNGCGITPDLRYRVLVVDPNTGSSTGFNGSSERVYSLRAFHK